MINLVKPIPGSDIVIDCDIRDNEPLEAIETTITHICGELYLDIGFYKYNPLRGKYGRFVQDTFYINIEA